MTEITDKPSENKILLLTYLYYDYKCYREVSQYYQYEDDSEEDSTEEDRETKLNDLLFLLMTETVLVSSVSQ